jgi:hypothetical protein
MTRRALLAMIGAASIHFAAAAMAKPTDRARRIGDFIFAATDVRQSLVDELRAKLPPEAQRWLDGMSAGEIALT